MKIFLDDERKAPTGWTQAHWPNEVIALLKTGQVEAISLDHDLGNDERGTGYDVILWIEEAVIMKGFHPPHISVHSANPAARIRMEKAIFSIDKHANRQVTR